MCHDLLFVCFLFYFGSLISLCFSVLYILFPFSRLFVAPWLFSPVLWLPSSEKWRTPAVLNQILIWPNEAWVMWKLLPSASRSAAVLCPTPHPPPPPPSASQAWLHRRRRRCEMVQIWIIILYFLSRSSADGASRLASEQISKQAFSRFFKHLSFKALRGGGGRRLSAHLRSTLPLNDPPVTLSSSHKVGSLAVKCPWSVFIKFFNQII